MSVKRNKPDAQSNQQIIKAAIYKFYVWLKWKVFTGFVPFVKPFEKSIESLVLQLKIIFYVTVLVTVCDVKSVIR